MADTSSRDGAAKNDTAQKEEPDTLQPSAIVGMTAAQLREELVRRGVEPPKRKADAMRLLKQTLKHHILFDLALSSCCCFRSLPALSLLIYPF